MPLNILLRLHFSTKTAIKILYSNIIFIFHWVTFLTNISPDDNYQTFIHLLDLNPLNTSLLMPLFFNEKQNHELYIVFL